MDLKKAIDHNFNLHIKELPANLSYMQVFEKSGFTYIDSALPVDTYNVIHITEGDNVQLDDLKEAVLFYENRLRKSCIWVERSEITENLKNIFEALNLKEKDSSVGMAMEITPDNLADFDMNVLPVMDKQAILDHAFVVSNNWDPFDTNVLKYYNALSAHILENDNLVLLSYLKEGITVGTIELMIEKDNPKRGGLYNLSVMKEERNQGIGSALSAHAIAMAKAKGLENLLLQASDDSKGIFAKLGFKEDGEFVEVS